MLTKDSYTINEVSDIVGVQPHVLRYWEVEFSQFSPKKNKAGERVYGRKDVEVVLRIVALLYTDKHCIGSARAQLAKEFTEGDQ